MDVGELVKTQAFEGSASVLLYSRAHCSGEGPIRPVAPHVVILTTVKTCKLYSIQYSKSKRWKKYGNFQFSNLFYSQSLHAVPSIVPNQSRDCNNCNPWPLPVGHLKSERSMTNILFLIHSIKQVQFSLHVFIFYRFQNTRGSEKSRRSLLPPSPHNPCWLRIEGSNCNDTNANGSENIEATSNQRMWLVFTSMFIVIALIIIKNNE